MAAGDKKKSAGRGSCVAWNVGDGDRHCGPFQWKPKRFFFFFFFFFFDFFFFFFFFFFFLRTSFCGSHRCPPLFVAVVVVVVVAGVVDVVAVVDFMFHGQRYRWRDRRIRLLLLFFIPDFLFSSSWLFFWNLRLLFQPNENQRPPSLRQLKKTQFFFTEFCKILLGNGFLIDWLMGFTGFTEFFFGKGGGMDWTVLPSYLWFHQNSTPVHQMSSSVPWNWSNLSGAHHWILPSFTGFLRIRVRVFVCLFGKRIFFVLALPDETFLFLFFFFFVFFVFLTKKERRTKKENAPKTKKKPTRHRVRIGFRPGFLRCARICNLSIFF